MQVQSRLAFRDTVTEILHQQFSNRDDCRIMHENGHIVDLDTCTLPAIFYDIVYRTTEQADLSVNPRLKDEGEILVTVLVKELTGNRVAIQLRDEIAIALQRQELSGAITQVGRLLPNSNLVKGWTGYRVAVPFWHYHF